MFQIEKIGDRNLDRGLLICNHVHLTLVQHISSKVNYLDRFVLVKGNLK